MRIVRSLNLLAHYSPAELGFLSDLQDNKAKLKVIGKNIISLKGFRIEGCSHLIHLRDTSLLAPSRPKLGEISKLYAHPLLEKLSVGDDYISRMDILREEKPILFARYAVNDAVITLHHGLTCEETNHKLTGELTIPVTLSSMSSQHLSNQIGGAWYDLPTKNGLYNVKDLPRLYTPTGMESSGGLAD